VDEESELIETTPASSGEEEAGKEGDGGETETMEEETNIVVVTIVVEDSEEAEDSKVAEDSEEAESEIDSDREEEEGTAILRSETDVLKSETAGEEEREEAQAGAEGEGAVKSESLTMIVKTWSETFNRFFPVKFRQNRIDEVIKEGTREKKDRRRRKTAIENVTVKHSKAEMEQL